MRILVAGGGVAGLTLAYWLHRRGMTPVVAERSAEGRLGGYGFDLVGTGHDIAARMDLAGRLAARTLPIDSVDFVDGSGRTLARLGAPLLDRITRGRNLALLHSTLEDELIEAVRDDVEIRFDLPVESLVQDADGVTARFPGGGEERFDLVVGATASTRPSAGRSSAPTGTPGTWAAPWRASPCRTATAPDGCARTTPNRDARSSPTAPDDRTSSSRCSSSGTGRARCRAPSGWTGSATSSRGRAGSRRGSSPTRPSPTRSSWTR
ncbi:FAD-dependent monooxygenase [Actinomadura sp. CNU-125]|uniref:FAD-dependent monooxygenase n=1 Tax=Actinomadura sp. CNU-125 TaxID=1904961 RepID=UPI0021CCB195|nr:FAD-dependent monooxygenase [Actinomadura sp. CNU-125]